MATRVIRAKVSSQGQVTIPAEVRRLIHVEKGGSVEFLIEPEGKVRVTTPRHTLDSLMGIFPTPRQFSEDFDEEIEQAMDERGAELMRRLAGE